MFIHCQHVKEVLKCVHKTNFYAKAKKYEFYSELVKYLGYILSLSGLTMSDNKVKIIQVLWQPLIKTINNILNNLIKQKSYGIIRELNKKS